jgi:hypothetical protein
MVITSFVGRFLTALVDRQEAILTVSDSTPIAVDSTGRTPRVVIAPISHRCRGSGSSRAAMQVWAEEVQ